jgi:hypothetical protein
MSQPYIPREGSVAAKVVAFFEANPEEELTNTDLCEKFDVNRTHVRDYLTQAVAFGLLQRDTAPGDKRVVVWRKGPGAAHVTAAERAEPEDDAPKRIVTRAAAAELPRVPVFPTFTAPEPIPVLRREPSDKCPQHPRYSLLPFCPDCRAEKEAQRPPAAKKGVRAAIWSSGELAIETEDAEVILFPTAVAREVIAFLKRVEVPA